MARKRKWLVGGEQNEEMVLQITSMADIFTIILVFLLKSYSSGLSTVTPGQGVVLPEANGQAQYKDALKIEIVHDSVLVDQKEAASLRNFVFPGNSALDATAKSEEVYRALMDERKKMSRSAADSHLLVLADQRTPYATLKKVMNSAATAGFVDLELAVVRAD